MAWDYRKSLHGTDTVCNGFIKTNQCLIISELSARGLMPDIGWLRSECHSRKDNLLLAKPLGQTHVFNIDPNLPYELGIFVGHRIRLIPITHFIRDCSNKLSILIASQ
jgi:hypothetical protein